MPSKFPVHLIHWKVKSLKITKKVEGNSAMRQEKLKREWMADSKDMFFLFLLLSSCYHL